MRFQPAEAGCLSKACPRITRGGYGVGDSQKVVAAHAPGLRQRAGPANQPTSTSLI